MRVSGDVDRLVKLVAGHHVVDLVSTHPISKRSSSATTNRNGSGDHGDD